MDAQRDFGERVRLMRARAGISQTELCLRIGTGRGHVSDIERGQVNVTLDTIRRLADALGCTMAELMPDGQISPHGEYDSRDGPI